MKLTCYTIDDYALDVKPASSEREWIDNTDNRAASRCLPLITANSHGWEIAAQDSCEATWIGGNDPKDIRLTTESGTEAYVASHFGYGILTFRVHCIIRTEPGTNLWITGPVNRFKDGIQPMSALIESDWMPYSFTMNWQFTRPGFCVRFEKGEPVCHFFPVPRGIVDDTEPRIRQLASDPPLLQAFTEWRGSRDAFIKALKSQDPVATAQKWQRHYFRGLNPDGSPGIPGHQTKIRPGEFEADTDDEDVVAKCDSVPANRAEGPA